MVDVQARLRPEINSLCSLLCSAGQALRTPGKGLTAIPTGYLSQGNGTIGAGVPAEPRKSTRSLVSNPIRIFSTPDGTSETPET